MKKTGRTPGSGNLARGNGLLIAGGFLCSAFIATAADSDNVRLHGTLISRPCQLATESESMVVEFGTIADRDLYAGKRTRSEALEIGLKECSTAVARSVKVTFTGTESKELPGLLAVNGSSGSQGVAIGLETMEGIALKLNEASGQQGLNEGETVIKLQAYVQGEPEAISSRKILPGEFRVTATFALNYE